MGSPNNNQQPVRARILWPALGFPGVVAPRAQPGESPFVQGDSTRSICLLIVSNRPALSKEEAARYLRFVPWAQRGQRYIAPGQAGSFREVDLAVRNFPANGPLVPNQPADDRVELFTFGGNADGKNAIVAGLARRVRSFYRDKGLQFFNEIRVYEQAAAKLQDGLYHLFWNNASQNPQAPSDEMDLLLREFAKPRRSKLGQLWAQRSAYLMSEYEYEYGSLHPPYNAAAGGRRTRAEILHPLFVDRRPPATVRVGQVSDIHVDVRLDVYEENLKQAGSRVAFDNWNKSFVATYGAAKRDSDVLLLTGDLIDYGRGHWGPTERNRLGDDAFYHEDRNWFLFYHLLASGDAYSRPSYTILGNHDWRLNPYPPMAIAGTPAAETMIHNAQNLTSDQAKAFLQTAHGPGHEATISYNRAVDDKYRIALKNAGRIAWQALRKLFGGERTMDLPGFPTETTVESVAWYLLAINPFLDYWCTLPSGHGLLMLDWAEKESVFFGDIYQGKRYASFDKNSGDEGPTAKNCLTRLQKFAVERFTEDHPALAKIIGIHAPPISPWDNWNDGELAVGWKGFDMGGRGSPFYTGTIDGKTVKGHPLFAIQPSKSPVKDAVFGMDASWNSFDQNRPWFITRVADPKYHVRLVMSGHIHRKGLFVAYKAGSSMGEGVAGEMLMKSVPEAAVRNVRSPAAAQVKVRTNGANPTPPPGPLYVTSTSVGPRGHVYPAKGIHSYLTSGYVHAELSNDGTIQQVTFKWVTPTQAAAPVPSAPAPRPAPTRVPTPAGAARP